MSDDEQQISTAASLPSFMNRWRDIWLTGSPLYAIC